MGYTRLNGAPLAKGMILAPDNGRWGQKLLQRVYVGEVSENLWIAQEVRIVDNQEVQSAGGKALSIQTDKDLRELYSHSWTKSVFSFKEGDAFVGASGDYYIAVKGDEVWNLRSGTWSSVTAEGVWAQYTKKDKLTKLQSSAGGDYSAKFKFQS